jgi:hypothetical protein
MPHPLENKYLKETDIPQAGESWLDIRNFASSFYGYDYFGSTSACTLFANEASKNFKEHNSLPDKLSELRSCLFFEQRRMVHLGSHPDEKKMLYIHALSEKIREKVRTGEFL